MSATPTAGDAAPAAPPERAPDPLALRAAIALVFALLAVASTLHFAEDRKARAPVERFAREFTLDERMPVYLETARLAPAADLAAAILADAVLEDALGSVRLNAVSPRLRTLWLESVPRREEEIAGAELLMRRALKTRPGWPFHTFMLGKLAYVAERQSQEPGPVARWYTPIRTAAQQAGGIHAAWTFLAGAELERWESLPDDVRAFAPKVFERAFVDRDFVGRAFVPATAAFGRERAASLLPDVPSALAAARELLGRSGDLAGYAQLHERWERAELRERARALAFAEERNRLGDVAGLDAACRAWCSAHGARDFDRRDERRQVARILELWPPDVTGTFREDPRGDLVRFFLEGRLAEVSGRAIARAVQSLTGVPEPVRATAYLLGADVYEYGKILRESRSVGALAWTPFLVRLARAEISSGRIDEAREALDKVAPAARGECDVLLARREMARQLSDDRELKAVSAEIVQATPAQFGAGQFSDGSLPLCVDPSAQGGGMLKVHVEAARPAFVAYGFDGGRIGTTLVSGTAEIRVPLAGREGRCTFFLRTLVGPNPDLRRAELVSPLEAGSSARLQPDAHQAAPRTDASVAGIAGREKLNSTTP